MSDMGGETPLSDAVAHWGRVINSFNVGRMHNTVLVFDSYYLKKARRQGLRAKNIKIDFCSTSAEISSINFVSSTRCRYKRSVKGTVE